MTTPRREEVVRIARRLKNARENVRPKLSQRAAAAAIRVSVRTLQDWEQGKHPPPAPRVADLAQLYRVSADYIVGLGSDELAPYQPAETANGEHAVNRVSEFQSSTNGARDTNGHSTAPARN